MNQLIFMAETIYRGDVFWLSLRQNLHKAGGPSGNLL
jgi:hypothetical protein